MIQSRLREVLDAWPRCVTIREEAPGCADVTVHACTAYGTRTDSKPSSACDYWTM